MGGGSPVPDGCRSAGLLAGRLYPQRGQPGQCHAACGHGADLRRHRLANAGDDPGQYGGLLGVLGTGRNPGDGLGGVGMCACPVFGKAKNHRKSTSADPGHRGISGVGGGTGIPDSFPGRYPGAHLFAQDSGCGRIGLAVFPGGSAEGFGGGLDGPGPGGAGLGPGGPDSADQSGVYRRRTAGGRRCFPGGSPGRTGPGSQRYLQGTHDGGALPWVSGADAPLWPQVAEICRSGDGVFIDHGAVRYLGSGAHRRACHRRWVGGIPAAPAGNRSPPGRDGAGPGAAGADGRGAESDPAAYSGGSCGAH